MTTGGKSVGISRISSRSWGRAGEGPCVRLGLQRRRLTKPRRIADIVNARLSNAGLFRSSGRIGVRALLIALRTGVANILSFAQLTETQVLLGILFCTSLMQKFILLRGHLRRWERV